MGWAIATVGAAPVGETIAKRRKTPAGSGRAFRLRYLDILHVMLMTDNEAERQIFPYKNAAGMHLSSVRPRPRSRSCTIDEGYRLPAATRL